MTRASVRRFVAGVAIAGLVPAGALYARAQAPAAPVPIGERMHDLHDQRPRPAAERAAGSTTGGAPEPAPAHQHRHRHHHHGATPAPASGPGAPSSPGGHDHGAPAGWKFTLPKGDAEKGRAVFVKLECYACHEVKGQAFPGVKDPAKIGPELSEMAPHHDVEFFAESIVNPNALIDEPEWKGPDGTSKMPSFNDSLSVQELIDLVAFLKSLTPPPGGAHKH